MRRLDWQRTGRRLILRSTRRDSLDSLSGVEASWLRSWRIWRLDGAHERGRQCSWRVEADDAALVEDGDPRSGRQAQLDAVRHKHHGAMAHELAAATEDVLVEVPGGVRIDRAEDVLYDESSRDKLSYVEKENRGGRVEGSRKGHAGLLTAGHDDAAAADSRLIAVLEVDEVAIEGDGAQHHLVATRVHVIAEEDVVADGSAAYSAQ